MPAWQGHDPIDWGPPTAEARHRAKQRNKADTLVAFTIIKRHDRATLWACRLTSLALMVILLSIATLLCLAVFAVGRAVL